MDQSSRVASRPCVVIAGGEPSFAQHVESALGIPALRLGADELDSGDGSLDGRLAPAGVVWIHLVPSLAPPASQDHGAGSFDEAALLGRSVGAARALGDRTHIPVTFVALLPEIGLFTGARERRCALASATMQSLMRTEIRSWSDAGDRIVAVTYAGLEGHAPDSQRSTDQVIERTPMKELATFAQLGDVLRFVGSRQASYVTGTVLRMDGGWTAYSWHYPAKTI
ncbi:MAG: SDR family oxidoreductase [bacterium]|nr:SDR family oxidoreductase [bacterium]